MTDHTKRHPVRVHCPLSHVTVMAAVLLTSFCSAAKTDEALSQSGSGFDFAAVDTDGSGCVQGPEEMQKFRLHVGKILEESLKLSNLESALRAGLITHSADVNGDGKICECDLLSILLADSTSSPAANKHAFRVYEDGSIFDGVDADDDGFLGNAKELEGLTQKLAQCVSEDRARRVIDAMSKLDKEDGKLSKGEYMLFLKSSLNIGTTPAPQPQPQPTSPGPQPAGDQAHQEEAAAGSGKQEPASEAGVHQDSPRSSSPPVKAGVPSAELQRQQRGRIPDHHPSETAPAAQSSSSPIQIGQGYLPGNHPANRPAQLPHRRANLGNRPVIKPLPHVSLRNQPQQVFSPLGLPSRRRALPPVGRRSHTAVSGNKPEGLPVPPMVLASQPRPVFRQMNAASRPVQRLANRPGQVFRRRMLTNPAGQQRFQPPLLQRGLFSNAAHQAGGSSRTVDWIQPQPRLSAQPAVNQPAPPSPQTLQAAQPAHPVQPVKPAEPSNRQPQPRNPLAHAPVESAKNPPSQPQKTKKNPQPATVETKANNTKPNGPIGKGGKKVDA